MKVECEIEETESEGDYAMVPSVTATCLRCGHVTMSFGTSSASVKRCLVVMREGCPKGENNFYVASDSEDEG